MYHNKLAVAIKVHGKVLREFGESVMLPFDSEYSILLKNVNSKRASAKVWVDGVEVTEGVSLVVEANEDIELERFIKNGNLNRGNRFKFIERTLAIVAHRGIKADDGLIRVEFQFEVDKPIYVVANQWPSNKRYGWDVEGIPQMRATYSSASSSSSTTNAFLDTGITTHGSISDQEFATVSSFNLESHKHVIVLRLQGEQLGKRLDKVVTVKSRSTCNSCGKREAPSAKFCSRCGTSLQIV